MTKIRRFFLPNVTAPFTTVPLQASLFKFAQKRHCRSNAFWCERRDLNPYGVTTRPSNVRVCQFRHSRIFGRFRNIDIILQNFLIVNSFLQKK